MEMVGSLDFVKETQNKAKLRSLIEQES